MKQIDIIKKAVSRKHPCHEVHKSIKELQDLIDDAPSFFDITSPDEDRSNWLKRAGLINTITKG